MLISEWKLRIKNPYYWFGIIATILLAADIEPATLTSWQYVLDALLAVVTNPYVLGLVVVDLVAVHVNPRTPGIKD